MLAKAFLSLLFVFSFNCFACPPGPGQNELTFTQVMINFGKYLRKADSLSLSGLQFPEKVTETDLLEAREGLKISLACAETSFGEKPLLPARIARLEDPKKIQDYTQKLQSFMRTFHFVLLEYDQELAKAKPTDKSQSYEKAFALSKKIQEWASVAHEYL